VTLGSQKSYYFANKAHCYATFVIVKLTIVIMLVITTKINVKLQQSTFNGSSMK
jgi:hypothetical protein